MKALKTFLNDLYASLQCHIFPPGIRGREVACISQRLVLRLQVAPLISEVSDHAFFRRLLAASHTCSQQCFDDLISPVSRIVHWGHVIINI